MKLTELATAIKNLEVPTHETILLYGKPKVGKTRLAATVAKIPWVERVVWFDLENGYTTLINMLKEGILTPEQAAKIEVFKIPDTVEFTVAYETMLKVFTSGKVEFKICVAHGRADCKDCSKSSLPIQGSFALSKMTGKDFVIVDTGSQLGDSILNYACKGKGQGYKPGWDEYGLQGRELSAFLSVVQQAAYCNFIVLAHELITEYEELGVKRERIVPQIGTANYSIKVGKYFAHIIYMEMAMKQHKAGSATTYKMDTITGSRSGWKIEKSPSLDLSVFYDFMTKGGEDDTGRVLVEGAVQQVIPNKVA